MDITEVRIKLMDEPGERLRAFCSITFDDCFVVRDLKIIEGTSGPFVAMPSRKLTSHCPRCGMKNHLRAAHCNQCGGRLEENRAVKDADGRAKLYADIAHPINSSCREMIQESVIQEFYAELERAKQPDYVPRYDDYDYDYSEPPRSKPTRVDQPHPQPQRDDSHKPSHVAHERSEPAHERSEPAANQGPHYGSDPPSSKPIHKPSNQPGGQPGGQFGAGIFPEP